MNGFENKELSVEMRGLHREELGGHSSSCAICCCSVRLFGPDQDIPHIPVQVDKAGRGPRFTLVPREHV